MTGWTLWEAMFERMYGPDWQKKRMGVYGIECDFCAGRRTTPQSIELAAKVPRHLIAAKGSCAS